MNLTVNYFGLIAEATECTKESLPVSPSCTVAALQQQLKKRYPALANKPFRIAVNRTFVSDAQQLQAADEIALLPPFAGG
jgi:molybdopterin converting factor subunit 1